MTEKDTAPIEKVCRDLSVEDASMMSGNEINSSGAPYLVFLNGKILGAYTRLRYLRT